MIYTLTLEDTAMLYKELIEFARPRLEDFFKNVKTFDNQFRYDDSSEKYYNFMYAQNSYDNIRTVKELKYEIPELQTLCKSCGSFFMKQRNNSIPKYDIIMGQQFENILIDFLRYKFKFNVIHGDKSNKRYPDCMILGKDKGIIAYFEVKYHASPFICAINKINRYCYEGSATLDYKKIIKQLEIIESDIERPVFYIHWIDYPCLKGIFFETSEQIKDYIYNSENLFERKAREGDAMKSPKSIYLKKIYSPLLYMGSFEEFIKKIQHLIKGI